MNLKIANYKEYEVVYADIYIPIEGSQECFAFRLDLDTGEIIPLLQLLDLHNENKDPYSGTIIINSTATIGFRTRSGKPVTGLLKIYNRHESGFCPVISLFGFGLPHLKNKDNTFEIKVNNNCTDSFISKDKIISLTYQDLISKWINSSLLHPV